MKCLTPIYIRNEKRTNLARDAYYQIPCSQCYNCLMRRVNGWAFRLEQELKVAQTAHFLTLTYDTKFVPINQHGLLTLDKSDLQKYWKRVRKAGVKNLVYFACGEYGTKTNRPHYHAIVYNAPLKLLESKWEKGHIHRGSVEPASIFYTLKYMMKRQSKVSKRDLHKAAEFQLMSKGIGKNYMSEAAKQWHLADLEERFYLPLPGGKKVAMPRYYKDQLYTQEQRERISKHVGELITTDTPLTESEKMEVIRANENRMKRTKLNTDKL